MDKIQPDTWVWVIVENPGGQEQYVGLFDAQTSISYIPMFQSKEDAQNCLIHLPVKRGQKYEIHAIMFEDLAGDAKKNGFLIFLIDAEGTILDRIQP